MMTPSPNSVRRFVTLMQRSRIPNDKWNEISRDRHELRVLSNRTGFALSLFPVIQFAVLPAITVLSIFAIKILNSPKMVESLQHSTSFPYQLLQLAVYVVSVPLIFLFLGMFLREKPFAKVQAGRIKKPLLLLPAGALTLAFVFFGNYASELIDGIIKNLGYNAYPKSLDTIPHQLPALIVWLLTACVLAPICEEFVFRGFLLQHFRRYGNVFAIFVTSALFGMLHENYGQTPFAFVVGLALGFFALYIGSIRATIVLHALVNTFSSVCSILALTYGEARVEQMIIFVFAGILLLAIVSLVVLYRRDGLALPQPPERAAAMPERLRSHSMAATPGFITFAAVTYLMILLQMSHV